VSAVSVVFRKELRESLRDRRSVMSALIMPVVIPLIVMLTMSQALEQTSSDAIVELPIVGREHAPGLVAHLESHGLRGVDAPADPDTAVRDRAVDVVLVIPADYGERFRANKPATIELIVDRSRNDTLADIRKVEIALNGYAARVGTLRMLARGVDPGVGQPIQVVEVDQATPQKLAATFLNVIPMFLLLAAFVGGLHVATDCTAGERERGSLEPLLITPAKRRDLLLGKWLATVVFSMVTVVLMLAGSLIAMSNVPLEKIGFSFSITPAQIATMLITIVPLTFLVTAVQLLVASFARSFREAQTYLSLMMLVPMVPGAILTVTPIDSASWMALIPLLGQQVHLTDILRGEPFDRFGFAIATVIALLFSMVTIELTARLYRRERIVYGR